MSNIEYNEDGCLKKTLEEIENEKLRIEMEEKKLLRAKNEKKNKEEMDKFIKVSSTSKCNTLVK